jgi:hypothetical protein
MNCGLWDCEEDWQECWWHDCVSTLRNNMRAVQKVISNDMLTKQAMRGKKILCTKKNTYILKLLLNIVTAGIEALVI